MKKLLNEWRKFLAEQATEKSPEDWVRELGGEEAAAEFARGETGETGAEPVVGGGWVTTKRTKYTTIDVGGEEIIVPKGMNKNQFYRWASEREDFGPVTKQQWASYAKKEAAKVAKPGVAWRSEAEKTAEVERRRKEIEQEIADEEAADLHTPIWYMLDHENKVLKGQAGKPHKFANQDLLDLLLDPSTAEWVQNFKVAKGGDTKWQPFNTAIDALPQRFIDQYQQST